MRLEDEGNQKQCKLGLMGATTEGRKELIAVIAGVRGSKQTWQGLLLDLNQKGLSKPLKLAVADQAFGFRAACREVDPMTRKQRCWVHKSANVLDELPKALQAKPKNDLQQIWLGEMVKLAQSASHRWRRLNGNHQPRLVLEETFFTDGVRQIAA